VGVKKMFLLTAAEMREMDRRTIEEFGLPGRILMENAGRGAFRVLVDFFPDIGSQKVAVMAGRGNNGGDGFVIARYLAQSGIPVTVYLLSENKLLQGDAAANFKLLRPLNISVRECPDLKAFNRYKKEIAHHRVIVDAILGTGLNSDVKGYFKTVIDFINSLNKDVLSVDIPSGLHTDTGRPCDACIQANVTATFAFPKIGHIALPGAIYCGKLHIIDIGIPPHIADGVCPRQHLLTHESIRSMIRTRPLDMHKGGTGHVLVVAGSTGKTGAAAMCALSALRSGAGLVTLGVPESLNPVIEPQALEVMTHPLPEITTGILSDESFDAIMELVSDKRCLAMGPGMGTTPETRRLVARLVKSCPIPLVIDADGLNNLAVNTDILKSKKTEIILTPHPGEMARLIGKSPKDVQADRIGCAREFALKYKVHLVLKGARTVIAHPDGHVHVNSTGNPGMASAGMGDVLTGMIAGVVSQGYEIPEAAHLAVYLHGAAADHLAESKGPWGYIASEVMAEIPGIIKMILGSM
jgi:ADP-dependent NAD(P)H-hydrate dehydratase / NAD(P)H-hydrate epimerase